MARQPKVTLAFLGRKIDQLITDNATFRDDVKILTAICIRIDGSLTSLVSQLDTLTAAHQRTQERVRKLETRG